MHIFEIGKEYQTQSGDTVKVLGRIGIRGYECAVCSDGVHRYDRSTDKSDAGRVTATDHDYSHPLNFKRTLFRFHRGGFDESMATVESVFTLSCLAKLVAFCGDSIELKRIGHDTRNGWETYMVTVDGMAVGFTNGALS